jgi:Glycosyl transferase family 2
VPSQLPTVAIRKEVVFRWQFRVANNAPPVQVRARPSNIKLAQLKGGPFTIQFRPPETWKGESMTIRERCDFSSPRVSVVIPALNEARNLPHVFAKMPAGMHKVILVDGYSVDDTIAVARNLRSDVRIVKQTRSGKGNALACGFAVATGDVIVMLDADGSADPGEIPQFVEALLNGANFAKSSRFIKGGGSQDITGPRNFGNRILTAIFNICYRTSYPDLRYGFNAFWRRASPVLGLDATSMSSPGIDGRLWGDDFEVETLIHIRAAKAALAVTEVPSLEHRRIHGVRNLNAFTDGVRVARTILTERRRSRRPRKVETVPDVTRPGRALAPCSPREPISPTLVTDVERLA